MLSVENLVVGYGGSPVARLNALKVPAGEAALLLGPSGSGKTSLLLGLAGLTQVVSGAMDLDGTDINRLTPGAQDRFRGRHIGIVFQDLHLIAGLSTLDNVLLAPFAAHTKQERKRAHALLDELGLAKHTHRRAETLSRGQAQRASIARAMLLRPKLLLADEPTASLDDASCAVVGELLLTAARETGAALIVATHDHRLKALIPEARDVEALV